jgi:aerobic carbon-monoxide dehydrogenase large subunit
MSSNSAPSDETAGAGTDRRHRVIGRHVLRRQDPALLTGRGMFVADVQRPGTLHMAVLRSRYAHARIARIDTTACRLMPGVALTLTAQDLAGLAKPLPVLRQGARLKGRDYPVLPADKAIYIGQPLAVVVATNRARAEDALEKIVVDYEPLPVVASVEDALRPGAAVLHEAWGDNIANGLTHETGDVSGALAEAAVVLTREFRIGRVTALPLEGRGVVAEYDRSTERLTVWYSSQAPHLFRTVLAGVLGFPEGRIHVIVRDVGGGFGLKLHYHAEEVLAAVATLRLARPVKWIEDRLESFIASTQAREQIIELTVGATAEGRISAVRAKILGDVGAHVHTKGTGPLGATADIMTAGYGVPNYAVDMLAVVTNKPPLGAYRGFGAPQAMLAMEGMLDRVAAELRMDPAELRLRNLLRPEQLPYRNPLGSLFDSGNYPETLRRALRLSGYDRWRAEQRERRAKGGRLLGIGLAFPVEIGGQGPCQRLLELQVMQGGYETADVRIDASGRVTVSSGIMEIGQGVNTALAQICAEELGVAVDDVDVVLGDTERTPYSNYGTGASRGTVTAGIAVLEATRRVKQKVAELAAHLLEVSPKDVEIEGRRVSVRGAAFRTLSLGALAEEAYRGQRLPSGMEPGLQARFVYDPEHYTYTCAAHVAVVEVDPETWTVRPLDYFIVHDCGTVINPRQVDGQLQGGVIGGLGEALLEELVYDGEGQLLTGTLMDYLLPTVNDTMPIAIEHMETPSPFSVNGTKGAGEGGMIGGVGAIVCAVADAVRPLGIDVRQCPVSPEVLFKLAGEAARREQR